MTFKELREAAGMKLPEFYKYFDIPSRTALQWEKEERRCPDYLLKLIEYKLKKENLI